MQKILLVCSFAIVLGFASFSVAQDKMAQTEASEDNMAQTEANEDKKNSSLEEAAEMTQIIMSKMLQKAGLDAEQINKVDEILKANVRNMVFKRDELTNFLTKEQQQTYNAARKLAKKAKYDEAKAEDYSLRKLELTAERMSAYKKLKKEVSDINLKIFTSIGKVMTPEQLEKVPMFKEMMPKSETKQSKAGSDMKATGSETKSAGSGGK